jgi:hypothetical protein
VTDRLLIEELVNELNCSNELSNILSSNNTKFVDDRLIWLDLGCKDIKILSDKVFNSLVSLEYLGLYGNLLKELPEGIFSKLKNLKYLDLGENNLSTLPKNVFKPLIQLERLWLYGNNFKDFSEDQFKNLENLVELNLNSNYLTNLNLNWFKNLRNLKRLEIALNNFTNIDKDAILSIGQLEAIIYDEKLQNGTSNIVNLIEQNEEKILIEKRYDYFVLLTGSMGSGKSTIMKKLELPTIEFTTPPKGKDIFFDRAFGLVKSKNHVINFFELDGPTVTSWSNFIKISNAVVIVVNCQNDETKKQEDRDLIKHILKNLRTKASLLFVLNNYNGEKPLKQLLHDDYIAESEIKVTYRIITIPPGQIIPNVGGLSKVIIESKYINNVFTNAIDLVDV